MRINVNAEPYRISLDPSVTALIVIDMQRDFIEPGGFGESLGNDVRPLATVIPVIQSLLQVFRSRGMTVVHTRECHRADLSDCPTSKLERGKPGSRIGDEGPMGRILIGDEPGAQIVPQLAPVAGELVVDKPGKGAFYNTQLSQVLAAKQITQLIFTGVTTEVCVQTTMREANDRGFDCLLVSDATESYFPHFKQATLDMIRAQGAIVGWTCTSHQLNEALNA